MIEYGNAEQYAGRTYDVMALQGVSAVGSRKLDQAFVNDEGFGTIATGVQKLAQKFVIEFLTDLGSMTYAPTRGSTFMPMFKQRRFRTELDVRAGFAIAASEVVQKLANDENSSDPPDERIAAAELLAVSFLENKLGITVQLKTRDPNREIILPLAIPIER